MTPSPNMMDGTTAAPSLPLPNTGKPTASDDAGPPRLRRWLASGTLLVALLAGGAALYFHAPGMHSLIGPPDPEAIAPRAAPVADVVVALGRLRPKDDIVTVAPPFGSGDARIRQLLVAEGDRVAAGQLLAVLDHIVRYESAFDSAGRQVDTSRAVLAQTIAQVAAAQAETRANVQSAQVALNTAEQSLRRARSLFADGVVTQEAVDAAERTAAAARGDTARLAATASRYEAGAGHTQVDIAVARANLRSAEAALAQARRDIDLARVHAPRAGTILDLAVREGEKVPPGGMLRLGDVERMEAELEVFQPLAPRVQVGQRVSIASEVLGDTPLQGTVTRVGMVVGRQSVTADDPAANTDARVVPVIVGLDRTASARAARFVGLEIVATIDAPVGGAGVGAGR